MKKLLLFLLIPANFIGAMVREKPDVIDERITAVQNLSNDTKIVFVINSDTGEPRYKVTYRPRNEPYTQTELFPIYLRDGDTVLVSHTNFRYSPTSSGARLALIIDENDARIIPAQEK